MKKKVEDETKVAIYKEELRADDSGGKRREMRLNKLSARIPTDQRRVSAAGIPPPRHDWSHLAWQAAPVRGVTSQKISNPSPVTPQPSRATLGVIVGPTCHLPTFLNRPHLIPNSLRAAEVQ